MSRILRWGDDSDSSDEEDIIRPSVIRNQLSHKKEDDSKSDISASHNKSMKANVIDHSNAQRTKYTSQNQSFHKQPDKSIGQSTGDYRQQSRSNLTSRGDSRQAGPSRNYPNPPQRRDWKEDARQSTLEKYSSVPSKTDGSSWMEQRIQKQKQREKEEMEKKVELERQREEEKRRKKIGQIEALKAALISKTKDEAQRPEIEILKPPPRKQEVSQKVQQELHQEPKQPFSSTSNTTLPSPPMSSLAKLALETSVPSSRSKLKLEPRTKPIPKVEADDKNNTQEKHPQVRSMEGKSSLAIAAKASMKKTEKDGLQHERIEGKKSIHQEAASTQEEGDDQSRMNHVSDATGNDRRREESANRRGGRVSGGRGNNHKGVHSGRGAGRGQQNPQLAESTSGIGEDEPSSQESQTKAPDSTANLSTKDRKHKWETKPDGSVIISRVRQGSVSSDKGSREHIAARGHGRGRGKQKGRRRGSESY